MCPVQHNFKIAETQKSPRSTPEECFCPNVRFGHLSTFLSMRINAKLALTTDTATHGPAVHASAIVASG